MDLKGHAAHPTEQVSKMGKKNLPSGEMAELRVEPRATVNYTIRFFSCRLTYFSHLILSSSLYTPSMLPPVGLPLSDCRLCTFCFQRNCHSAKKSSLPEELSSSCGWAPSRQPPHLTRVWNIPRIQPSAGQIVINEVGWSAGWICQARQRKQENYLTKLQVK